MIIKIVFSIMICILIFYNCNTDLSPLNTVKSGIVTLNTVDGFDFSHNRIIEFRSISNLSEEQKKKAIDLMYFSRLDSNIIHLLGPPLYTDYGSTFTISPDTLNPSIKNLEVSDINQVTELSNISFLPNIRTSIDNIFNKPVFAIKTTESKYAIFEITDIDTITEEISFEWKYQTNGSADF